MHEEYVPEFVVPPREVGMEEATEEEVEKEVGRDTFAEYSPYPPSKGLTPFDEANSRLGLEKGRAVEDLFDMDLDCVGPQLPDILTRSTIMNFGCREGAFGVTTTSPHAQGTI